MKSSQSLTWIQILFCNVITIATTIMVTNYYDYATIHFSLLFSLSSKPLLLLTPSFSWNENGEIFQNIELDSTEFLLTLFQPLDSVKITIDNPNSLQSNEIFNFTLEKDVSFTFSTNKEEIKWSRDHKILC